MTPDELRQAYLDFFEAQGHAVVPSSPLVPENDPTTLFTGSGMQPMVPYLLGETHPKGKRIVDSQKCFRSQDIEEVGDNRHTTFFEMLGNWSLGDYFKKEQLRWFFTFLTEKVGLEPEKLFVTVFRGSEELNIPKDTESVEIWKELFKEVGIEAEDKDFAEKEGMQGGRIFYYDEKKNWWSRSGVPANMPPGEPGGPDSEVFYDFGAELQLHENSSFKNKPCHVNCDCGRFLEIGNSVFMQYQKQADGSFAELAQKNVDFGGGLERILAVKHGTSDVFETELFSPIIKTLETLSGKNYESSDDETKWSFRVIADHARAAVMLAADGVFPSNKAQGYFSRRMVRRAIRYGKMIGINELFFHKLVADVAKIYKNSYPDVAQKNQDLTTRFHDEEKRFNATLEKGLKEFEHAISGKVTNIPELTAKIAFRLYETFGFPLELSLEEAQNRGIALEENISTQFDKLRQSHAEASRTASAGMFKGGLADHSEVTTKYHTATHLLQAALREVLGKHVQQKGSNITGERLRFDFTHTGPMTDDEKAKVEDLVNEWVKQDLPVTKQTLPKQKALESGAIAFFIEKYPDEVTVYTIGSNPDGQQGVDWISKEFCGGPHVNRTGEIGQLKLTKEQAVSAGVRRVYMELG